MGYLSVEAKDGKNYGFITNPESKTITVDVVAADSVEKANWFVLSMRAIGGFFGDIFSGVSSTVKGWFKENPCIKGLHIAKNYNTLKKTNNFIV